MTPSQKSTLRRNAKNHRLNPDHLFKIARNRDADDVEILRKVAEDNGWGIGNDAPDEIPWGMWIDTACQYIEGGADRLVELATGADSAVNYFEFVVALLKDEQSEENVMALVQIAEALPGISLEGADIRSGKMSGGGLLSEALNLILSLKGAPEIPAALEGRVRSFLHSEIERDPELEPDLSLAIYALRGVGDESSLELMERVSEMPDPWDDAVRDAKRAIKKRLKNA